jgi:hypothetical protein
LKVLDEKTTVSVVYNTTTTSKYKYFVPQLLTVGVTYQLLKFIQQAWLVMVTVRRQKRSSSSASAPPAEDDVANARKTRSLSVDAASSTKSGGDQGEKQPAVSVTKKVVKTEEKSQRRGIRSRGIRVVDLTGIEQKMLQQKKDDDQNDNVVENENETEVDGKVVDHGRGGEKMDDERFSDTHDTNHEGSEEDDDHEQPVRPEHENECQGQRLHVKSMKQDKGRKKEGNALTHLIPGYTAPMKLNTSSLDKFRPPGGIRELQRRAERTDASTKDFVLEATSEHTKAMQKTDNGFLPKSYALSYASFKRGTKRAPDNSAGKGWFGMEPSEMTEQLKTDLAIIRNRAFLDPKKFYKSAEKSHKIVQVGTVVEGPTEYFSSRLTKKQRRSNITEEIMADQSSADYAKKKFKQMSREKTRQAEMRKLKPKRVKKLY